MNQNTTTAQAPADTLTLDAYAAAFSSGISSWDAVPDTGTLAPYSPAEVDGVMTTAEMLAEEPIDENEAARFRRIAAEHAPLIDDMLSHMRRGTDID